MAVTQQPLTGTHQSAAAPWESYAAEMTTKHSAELEQAIADYSDRMYDTRATSNQNKEELHRQREMNEEISEQYQWARKDEYDDEAARIGTPMTHMTFINKLRSIGIECHYRQHVHLDKADLYIALTPGGEQTVQCWVQQGWMQELSVLNFDTYGVPLAERRRGWRTPLLQLILKGVITEEKANKLFGRPKITDAYHRYNASLQAFRNNGNSLTLHGEESQ